MISVLIIAHNEEKFIKGCLDSVKWADEIIVVDDNSTDKTVELAKKYTDKVYSRQLESIDNQRDFSKIRNFGLSKATGEWLLCVDADERILQPLRQELQQIILTNPSESAFKIPRRNIILGEEKRYAAFWPDFVIRLFKRTNLKGWSGRVHEQPQFEGDLGTIKNPFLHLTHRDIDSMVLKSLSWASIDAKLRMEAGHPPMTGIRFLRIIATEMWNQGIVRKGFFNGTVGVIDSLLQVFSLYITYVKLWQLQRRETLTQTYQNIDKILTESDFRY